MAPVPSMQLRGLLDTATRRLHDLCCNVWANALLEAHSELSYGRQDLSEIIPTGISCQAVATARHTRRHGCQSCIMQLLWHARIRELHSITYALRLQTTLLGQLQLSLLQCSMHVTECMPCNL